MSQKDTDDVLDFINSLPDSRGGTPATGKNSDDFLDFLDELTAHDKAAKPKPKLEPKKRDDTPEARAKSATPETAKVEAKVPVTAPVGAGAEGSTGSTQSDPTTGNTNAEAGRATATETNENAAETTAETNAPEVDPIASISSWWSTEGSSKVSSLWGQLTSNAQQLGESTYQLASTTSQSLSHQRQKFLKENSGGEADQILHITDKLNAMLGSVSQQIKDGLMDQEDELLNILLVYDLTNLSYLDSLCAQKFNKVMGQVEGGIRTNVSNFNHKHEQRKSGHVELDMFHGKAIDGEKLCYANLDSSIKDYLKITQHENKDLVAEEGGINTSNVFIAIQPITTATDKDKDGDDAGGVSLIEANSPTSFAFTMILRDITNNIKVVSKSQPFPLRWARWVAGDHADVTEAFGGDDVDPSEWVQEWIQDGLGLTFAVLAQEYVTKRMGM